MLSQILSGSGFGHWRDLFDHLEPHVDIPPCADSLNQIVHALENPIAIGQRKESHLTFDQTSIRNNVQSFGGPDESMLLTDIADKFRIASDDPANVDNRTILLLR